VDTDITDKSVRPLVAAVWLVHGLYNKLLGGSPRHLAIVQSVLGLAGSAGERVLTMVGLFEVALALWILSGRAPRRCAATQTVVLLSMNVVELTFARHLLLSPLGLLPLNLVFLTFAWIAAGSRWPFALRAFLQRHPIPIEAHLEDCLTLTYALPPGVLRPLLPPGLELDTFGGYGFVAVALVQTRSLHPAWLPKGCRPGFLPRRLSRVHPASHGRRTDAPRPSHPAQRRGSPDHGRRRQSADALQLSPL
jgi:uncharacterized membrane protein YphA (DoxX/SURF4 family)